MFLDFEIYLNFQRVHGSRRYAPHHERIFKFCFCNTKHFALDSYEKKRKYYVMLGKL
jgi:hypothetical protein